MKIAVLGAGSWGTALAILLGRNGHSVWLLGREGEPLEELVQTRENARYLPGAFLPETVSVGCIGDDPGGIEAWFVATPAVAVGAVVELIPDPRAHIVLASKGLEPKTGSLLSDVVKRRLPESLVGAIGGPNLAAEVVRGVPTATLSACEDEAAARRICEAMTCPTFRAYYSDDLAGVELAGALKNVLAIGAGISDGLGFGDNTKGTLIARGLREMTTIGVRMGADLETFFGIAGVGDLFATANSKLSRNYRMGRRISEFGETPEQALVAIDQVAEGVGTADVVRRKAKEFGIELPLMCAIDAILKGELPPRKAVEQLMSRDLGREKISGTSGASETV